MNTIERDEELRRKHLANPVITDGVPFDSIAALNNVEFFSDGSPCPGQGFYTALGNLTSEGDNEHIWHIEVDLGEEDETFGFDKAKALIKCDHCGSVINNEGVLNYLVNSAIQHPN